KRYELWGSSFRSSGVGGSLGEDPTRLMAFTGASSVLFEQLDMRGRVQVARVAFVGVEMDFQFAGLVGPHQQVFKDGGALERLDTQLHEVAVFHAEVLGVAQAHVHMPGGADDA